MKLREPRRGSQPAIASPPLTAPPSAPPGLPRTETTPGQPIPRAARVPSLPGRSSGRAPAERAGCRHLLADALNGFSKHAYSPAPRKACPPPELAGYQTRAYPACPARSCFGRRHLRKRAAGGGGSDALEQWQRNASHRPHLGLLLAQVPRESRTIAGPVRSSGYWLGGSHRSCLCDWGVQLVNLQRFSSRVPLWVGRLVTQAGPE